MKEHINNRKDVLPKIASRESDLASISNFIGNIWVGGTGKDTGK